MFNNSKNRTKNSKNRKVNIFTLLLIFCCLICAIKAYIPSITAINPKLVSTVPEILLIHIMASAFKIDLRILFIDERITHKAIEPNNNTESQPVDEKCRFLMYTIYQPLS
jgi:hypothetical protein